jgi:hypothetical protein
MRWCFYQGLLSSECSNQGHECSPLLVSVFVVVSHARKSSADVVGYYRYDGLTESVTQESKTFTFFPTATALGNDQLGSLLVLPLVTA